MSRRYGEIQEDDTLGDRSANPYVATPDGFRRKIGPKSRYGMNPATGDQVPSSQRQKTPTRLGSMPSRLGTAIPQRESGFSASMRESDEQAAANKAYLAQKNPPAKASASTSGKATYSKGKMSLSSTLSSARASSRKAKKSDVGFSNGKMHLT